MNRIPMSRAASGLFRALLDRACCQEDRILLSEIQSHEWQSLTFAGERHHIVLRITGPDAEATALSVISRIEDAEFSISGQIVADITAATPIQERDGSRTLSIEALTIAE